MPIQSAFLHFKKYKKILSTWSYLDKYHPNFVYPKLIPHNRIYDTAVVINGSENSLVK